MTNEVNCTYSATAPTPQSMTGIIKLTGCDPAIGNNETLSSFDVIAIVAGIVVLGLIIQWAMLWLRSHVDRDALNKLKTDMSSVKGDLRNVVKVHPDVAAS